MSRRAQELACIVCATPWPEPGCSWTEYGWVTCHPACTDILDSHMRDYTFSTRGRWRSKAEVLRSLRGETAPPLPALAVPLVPPPGPHTLMAWGVSRQQGHRIVAAWCPWCIDWHYHGLPDGSGPIQHRAAHCRVAPGLGDYHLVVVGWLRGQDLAWIRTAWAHLLGHNRRRILRARGAQRAYQLVWPAPYQLTPWERSQQRKPPKRRRRR